MVTIFRAKEHHLPQGITQYYLPHDTGACCPCPLPLSHTGQCFSQSI